MASTFTIRATVWRVRGGTGGSGNELNGGGFCPYVTGAGTDYSDQDSPQVNSTTGTCTVGSTTWTDSSAPFTAAMVGNVIRISAKTGGTATALDYFVVTGYADASNVTLDRSPCATSNITAATYRLGGAHASLINMSSSSTGGLGTAALSTPLLAGHQIWIRGDGSEDTSTATFDWSAGHWVLPNGDRANGPISIIGYNGRPLIEHDCAIYCDQITTKHIATRRKVNSNPTQPLVRASANISRWTFQDGILDQNGFDCVEFDSAAGSCSWNIGRNSGGGAAGTQHFIKLSHPASHCIGNYIKGVRGPAISLGTAVVTTIPTIAFNTIVDNLSDGIKLNVGSTGYFAAVFNNTIDNNGGHGIDAGTGAFSSGSIFNNIISNHTGGGKYGINFADARQTNRRLRRSVFDYNCYFGNTDDFNTLTFESVTQPTWFLQTNDLAVDPQYFDTASGNYATGANMRSKGFAGLGGLNGTLGAASPKVNIGAFQGVLSVVSGTATLDGISASGGMAPEVASGISGGATLDDVSASGSMSVVASDVSGSASLGDVSAAGDLGSSAPSDVSGSATLDDIAASGGLGSTGASDLGGSATLDDITVSGNLSNAGASDLSGGATLGGITASGNLAGGGFIPINPAASTVLRVNQRSRIWVVPNTQ